MICAKSEAARYQTSFSDGEHACRADTTADKGGASSGFRPHGLLEAALATCVNMTVRMYADHHEIPLQAVTTRVSIDRADPARVVFRYEIDLAGDLTEQKKERLLGAASACPVRKTLSRKIEFTLCNSVPDSAVR